MKWVKPEDFKNLTKMSEHEQGSSLIHGTILFLIHP